MNPILATCLCILVVLACAALECLVNSRRKRYGSTKVDPLTWGHE